MLDRSGQRYYCCRERAEFNLDRAIAQQGENVMKRLNTFRLSHAGQQRIRYRARAFNSDYHPFQVDRSAIRVRAKYGFLPPSDLSTNSSCSLPSSSSSFLAPTILGLCKVWWLFSFLSKTCTNLVEDTSARIAEEFRQLLDPMVLTSGTGIEIEGLGARLVRDAHTEQDSDLLSMHTRYRTSTNLCRRPPNTLPWIL